MRHVCASVLQFYPEDVEQEIEVDEDENDLDDEEKAKRKLKERKKNFFSTVEALKASGQLQGKGAKTLEKLFMKKDEAVTKAFEQYIDAPNPGEQVWRNVVCLRVCGVSARAHACLCVHRRVCACIQVLQVND